MHFIFASWLDPFVTLVTTVINVVNIPLHSLGWSLVVFAALLRLVFWPLNTSQFKTMVGMQKIGPKMKQIQAQFKGDPKRMQEEQMKLYKSAGVNPMAGCLPLLVQMPFLFSVFYAVRNNPVYAKENWLWIGSSFSLSHASVLATSLAAPDLILLVLYIASMYFSMRYTSMPSTDPAQAQTQKIMAIMSPAMIAWFSFKAHWPSALMLYWFALNVFTMAQQLYLLRKYHQPLSVLDSEHVISDVPEAAVPAKVPVSTNGNPSRKKKKRQRR